MYGVMTIDDSLQLPELAKLEEKISSSSLPSDLSEKARGMIERVKLSMRYGGALSGLEQVANYIEWITSLPWSATSQDSLDLKKAGEILEKNHHGLKDLKDRLLEYLAVLKLKHDRNDENQQDSLRAPILCFVGLVGTGKTTIAYSIAEAMGRKFVRIPFGGMGSALDLRGQSRVHPDSEPGQVIKALRRAGTRNPVILLDELDRVSDAARGDIMGVLVELLDPEQNMAFVDHYIDYPFNLSQALFIATANNTTHIATAVLDRLEPLSMPSYTDEEKIVIARDYVLPKVMKETGVTPQMLTIAPDVWPIFVRPLGFDAGIRTLERTIQGLCRKVARFIVEGKGQTFTITKENSKEFVQNW